MTREDILINFLSIEQPTTKQIIETVKILIRKNLKITDDGFEINPLTGERVAKIDTKPKYIDTVTDISIMVNIAKAEIAKQLAVVPVKTDVIPK